MKLFRMIVLAAIWMCILTPEMHAQEISVEAMPAVVVKTVPQAGDLEVDPGLQAITVTFSKVMADKSWSFANLSQENFPEVTDSPRYLDDRRTCVLPVKLEAGKTYAIWVNSNKHLNFKDAEMQPSIPYLLVFKTRKK